MYNNQTIMAIIPARAGSKGIKDKNIVDLAGKPLIAYTIEAALKSSYIDEVYVSTDGEKIAEVAKKYGARVPFLRSKELASDIAPTNLAILEHMKKLLEARKGTDHMILLQPTSPLRTRENIDEAIKIYFDEKADNIVSVKPLKESLELVYSIDEEKNLNKYLEDDGRTRRQDFKKYYVLNGAIYITSWENYIENQSFYIGKTRSYVMSEEESVDIDDMLDLKFARVLIEEKNNKR